MAFHYIYRDDVPGPGVKKDEPNKAAPLRFLAVFVQKFFTLVRLNLIFMIPMAISSALSILLLLFPTHLELSFPMGEAGLSLNLWSLYVAPTPLILASPFLAGLAYVTRNIVQGRHVFLWSDFWGAVKGNWKNFLFNGIFCYFSYSVLSFAGFYYYANSVTNPLYYLPLGVCILLAVQVTFAQFYTPVMFVTFELKFKDVYRNALIFSITGLWRNLLIAGITGGLLFIISLIPFNPITMVLLAALLLCIVFSFESYLINFTIYPVIDKHLIKPYLRLTKERSDAAGGA